MRFVLCAIILSVLLFRPMAEAASREVAPEITVAQDPQSPWKEGQNACVMQGNKTRCGKVVRANDKEAVVRLELKSAGIDVLPEAPPPTKNARPARGKATKPAPVDVNVTVKLESEDGTRSYNVKPGQKILLKNGRQPSNVPQSQATVSRQKPTLWNAGVGVGGGFNYFFPTIHFQRRVGKRFAMGVMPFFSFGSTSTTKVTALGAFLTATYFLKQEPFLGFNLSTGVGYTSITAKSGADSFTGGSVAVPFQLGWRAVTSYRINFALGAGLQYVARVTGDASRINFAGVYPLFSVEVGYGF